MKPELKIAIEAALAGGDEIMKVYESGEFEIENKEDNSPLTVADKNANDVILNYLEKTAIPVISEETKEISYNQRKNWDECWIVDPLDGTKEFIKKNGEFTVNISLIKKGRPILGVIFIPATNILYFANVELNKAYKVKINQEYDLDQIIKRATEIRPSRIDKVIRVVGSRSHMNKNTEDFISTLEQDHNKNIEIVSKGSSLKFCLVAEGLADVYPRFAPTMEWDTAAGQAICEAVGLKVIDEKTAEPMVYNRENLLNNYFLVSNLG